MYTIKQYRVYFQTILSSVDQDFYTVVKINN